MMRQRSSGVAVGIKLYPKPAVSWVMPHQEEAGV